MQAEFVGRLTAQSTLAEIPAFDVSLDLEERGEVLGETLSARAELPGVVVTDGGVVKGALSRGQYLRLVSRHLGREVYHPRPIRLLFEASAKKMEEPLVLEDVTPIQEAVRCALERPRELLYEPLIVKSSAAGEDGEVIRLVDFQDLLMADSRISVLRNQQMRQILDTVREGFLLVDADHRIAPETSRSVEAIFGVAEIGGRRFEDVLETVLGAQKAELGGGYLDTLFNPNVIEKLVTKINPLLSTEAQLPDGSRKRLAFRFTRGMEGRTIRRVLVRVEDTTRETALAEELERQEQRTRDKVDLVFEIVRSPPEGLASFLNSLGRTLTWGEELLAGRAGSLHEGLPALARTLHGLKGEAGLLGMRLFPGRLHQLEDLLSEVSPDSPDGLESLRGGIARLAGTTKETQDLLKELGRLAGADRPAREEAAPQVTPDAAQPEANGHGAVAPLQPEGLFDGLDRLTVELAARHGKVARFYTGVGEDEIPTAYRPLVRQLLVQLARNAVVHGIEEPEVRRSRGKAEMGTFQFALRKHERHLELIFQDDGRGLDLEKIRHRARELGREVPDADLPHLIFEGGFSTAETTTQDAGRGVGMDLVKDLVESNGGTLRPHFQPQAWCAFQVLLPAEPPEQIP